MVATKPQFLTKTDGFRHVARQKSYVAVEALSLEEILEKGPHFYCSESKARDTTNPK
jgi:hypothetical protein